jgi:molybdopterin-binding protein
MPARAFTVAQAAHRLGVSASTVRRWGRLGRLQVETDARGRIVIPESEIDAFVRDSALRPARANRFNGRVVRVEDDGLVGQVELVVPGPVRLVALVTRDSVEELGLERGISVQAVIKSTSVMVMPTSKADEPHG